MNKKRLVTVAILACASSLWVHSPLSLAAGRKDAQSPPPSSTQAAPPATIHPAPQTQTTPPDQNVLAVQARLDAIEKTIGTQRDSIGDMRTLIYVLISTQFAIIIAFLTLAWWIEQKIRKFVETVDVKVAEAKAALDGHFNTAFSEFQARIAEAWQSLSKARVVQDLLLAGKVLFWTGKPEKALEAFNSALPFNQSDPEVRKFRGLSLKQIGREHIREAIDDLEFALSSDAFRNDASTYLELARSYLTLNEWPKAIDRATLAQMNGHPSKEETQMVIADALKGMRDYDEAIALYDGIIGANPRCTPAILHKAEILSQRNALDEVIALFQKSISHRGNVSKYHIFLGSAYAERNSPGDWEQALDQFDEAQKASENDWDLWYYKGRAYLHKWLACGGQKGAEPHLLDEAMKCFRHGERISRKDGAPRFINQISRLHLLSGKVDEAVTEARRSVTMTRDYIQNHLALCTALLACKKWPEAFSAAQEGLEHSVNPPGKIWCHYFIVLAKALQRYTLRDLLDNVAEMLRELENAPYFDVTGWDWATTQRVISEEVLRLPENVKEMLRDLSQALEKPGTAPSISQKLVP